MSAAVIANATAFPASVLARQINEQRTNRSKCDWECEWASGGLMGKGGEHERGVGNWE